jgi:hypothetical protein
MTLNVFNAICFTLFLSAMIKVFLGICFHHQLYDFARKTYSSPKITISVKILMIYALFLLVIVWVGTIFFYRTHGWILTSFISIASIKTLGLLFNWQKTSQKFVKFINTKYHQLWIVDLFVAMLGITFLVFGITLYR